MARAQLERTRPSPALARERGVVLGRILKFAEAEAALREAIALDERDPTSWAYLGMGLDRLGKKDEARSAYERALRLDPAQEKARQGLRRL